MSELTPIPGAEADVTPACFFREDPINVEVGLGGGLGMCGSPPPV